MPPRGPSVVHPKSPSIAVVNNRTFAEGISQLEILCLAVQIRRELQVSSVCLRMISPGKPSYESGAAVRSDKAKCSKPMDT